MENKGLLPCLKEAASLAFPSQIRPGIPTSTWNFESHFRSSQNPTIHVLNLIRDIFFSLIFQGCIHNFMSIFMCSRRRLELCLLVVK